MPPPTHTTVPNFSMCVGRPSGPTRFSMASPTASPDSLRVVAPTTWKISVTVPASASASAMVNGILSPYSVSSCRMMNCPGLRSRAISGASTTRRYTSCESCCFWMILFMAVFSTGAAPCPAVTIPCTAFPPAWPTQSAAFRGYGAGGGAGTITGRKPMERYSRMGGAPSREAERQSGASRVLVPPRMTRLGPVSGPVGSVASPGG